jgi:hypothetical protein
VLNAAYSLRFLFASRPTIIGTGAGFGKILAQVDGEGCSAGVGPAAVGTDSACRLVGSTPGDFSFVVLRFATLFALKRTTLRSLASP